MLYQLFEHVKQWLRPKRKTLPPETMPDEAKQAAFAEARRLHALYAVDVRALAEGERPALPRPAKPDTTQ